MNHMVLLVNIDGNKYYFDVALGIIAVSAIYEGSKIRFWQLPTPVFFLSILAS